MKNKHAFLDPRGWSIFARPALHENAATSYHFFLDQRQDALDRCGAAGGTFPPTWRCFEPAPQAPFARALPGTLQACTLPSYATAATPKTGS